MREIKFRVWDTERESMDIPYFFESSGHSDTGYRYYEGWRELEDGVSWPCEVMQFTGLKDANGVEIYEGDVLQFTTRYGFESDLMNEWRMIHNLPSLNGIGELFEGVVVVDIHRGLMLKRLDNDYAEPLFTRHYEIKTNVEWATCTVIGNIYENPELVSPAPDSNSDRGEGDSVVNEQAASSA